MELITQIITAAVFYTFVYIVLGRLYSQRTEDIRIRLPIFAAAAAGLAAIGSIGISALSAAYAVLSTVLLNFFLYRTKDKSFVLYDVIIVIFSVISGMLTELLLSAALNMRLDSLNDDMWKLLAVAGMYGILMFFFCRIFLFFIHRRNIKTIRYQELVFFIVLFSGEILLLKFITDNITLYGTLFDAAFLNGAYELAVILLSLFALDMYLAYLLDKLSQSYLLEKQYELVEQQSRLQLEAYRNLSEKYADSRKVIHDVKKHIASLEGLIQTDPQEAIKYKALMEKELNKLLPVFDFDDPILNVVLNSKRVLAEKNNIKFTLDIRFSRLDFMTELDRTAIVSNLLDNAFEACEELPEDMRFVNFGIIRHNDLILIYTENGYGMLKQDGGNFLSTKDEHSGLGLSIVRSAAEKYNGYLSVRTENDKFIAETVIPINAPQSKNDK